MREEIQIAVLPEVYADEQKLRAYIQGELGLYEDFQFHILKRSIDARKKPVKYLLKIEVYLQEPTPSRKITYKEQDVRFKSAIYIIGAGPAGLFAGLRAIELGLKPVIFERGKDVQARRRDLAKIHKEHLVNPESNYCFGEGGAGTYSDGKLYTRSKKRGDVSQVLNWFVDFGASQDILIDAHPHIGTNRLPGIIKNIRETIIRCGGEFHFSSKLTDIFIEDGRVVGIEINGLKYYDVRHLILATGHSARDIFELLHKKKVTIQAKPFALGVRLEHPQSLINKIQYHGCETEDLLPPASYSWVEQVRGLGVYSFCMCPGGIVAPCATEPSEVVTNGWSPSKRNNPFANAGIVVQVRPEDLPGNSNDPFICLNYQRAIERKCWEAAGKTQAVPAQRLTDFVAFKKSKDLPKSSYQPGIVSVNLHDVLPELIASRLREAFVVMGKKMKGYVCEDAVLHAPESRTSSPVKIPRDAETLEHIEVRGLYPCGEGAGYAGGIVSAAIDGIKCAEKIKELLTLKY
jgi:uncharacterized FAD-dependent dehydrogenase